MSESFTAAARGFGAEAERYERTRPQYPQPLIDRIVATAPGRDVLDVGIGTGIVARQLAAAGCRVLGVDVDERMAQAAHRDGFEVEVAPFEDWDPAGRTFDAVVAGQAWHWINPAGGAAKAAQALRPGGLLAVFWNVFQPPADVALAFAEVTGRVAPGPTADFWARPMLDAYTKGFAIAADGMRGTGAYGEPEEWRYEWVRPYTRDEWLDQMPTHGGWAQWPPEVREALLRGIGDSLDALGGAFTMGYTTVAVTAVRR